jgi:hypothetical protein
MKLFVFMCLFSMATAIRYTTSFILLSNDEFNEIPCREDHGFYFCKALNKCIYIATQHCRN